MKTSVIIAGIFLAASLSRALDCESFVAGGRSLLIQSNITAANNFFASAVAMCPNNETANALYAVTRLAVLPSLPAGSNFLNRLGFPKPGRNIYRWTAKLPTDTNGVPLAPAGVNASEATAMLRTNVLPALIAAEANLARVLDLNFTLMLTAAETKMGDVTVDFADVQMLRALLHAAEYFAYTTYSWNLDAQLSAIRSLHDNGLLSVERVLRDYPHLLTFATTNDLNAARTAFQRAAGFYMEASELIRSRPPNVVRLFNADAASTSDEAGFRQTLIDLTNSLACAVVLHKRTNFVVHLGRHFDGSHAPREFLPQFQSNSIVLGTLADLTFGGLVFGLERRKVESFLGLSFNVVPSFGTPVPLRNGAVQLQLNTMAGMEYSLLASADLSNWTEIAKETAGGELLTFTDGTAGGFARRFYRASQRRKSVIPPSVFYGSSDSFASRRVITGTTLAVYAYNFGFTREAGEPSHSQSYLGYSSAWWTWTAPRGGVVRLTTQGSLYPSPWMIMAVYTGDNLFSLNQVASSPPGVSAIHFNATAGTTYQIVVAEPSSGISSSFTLSLAMLPPLTNDDFADEINLGGSSFVVNGHILGATSEPGEPNHFLTIPGGSLPNRNSVWWAWTAPDSGSFTVTVRGNKTYYGPVFAIYTGLSVSSLTAADTYDIIQPDPYTGYLRARLNATAGTTYHIAVEGGGYYEDTFRLELVPTPAPANDNFAGRICIGDASLPVFGSNRNATTEPGEPAHDGNAGGSSVWWLWTAPVSGSVKISTVGSDFDTVLGVYRGNSVSALTLAGSDDDSGGNLTSRVVFNAVAGTTYQIAVDGFNGDSGTVRLSINAP